MLAQDVDSTVRWNALLHPMTPTQALQTMADQEAAALPGLTRVLICRRPGVLADGDAGECTLGSWVQPA
jgi:hypothetical protein